MRPFVMPTTLDEVRQMVQAQYPDLKRALLTMRVNKVARKLGIRVPSDHVVPTEEELDALPF